MRPLKQLLRNLRLRHFGKPDEGQALLIGALAMVVLLLMAGLAADVGYLLYQKQQMQKAADAGAVGAAMALSIYGSNDGQSQIRTAGQADSAANGFTNGNNGITVAVNNPPANGPYSTVGDSQDYVEVTVSQTQPTFFMKVGGYFSVPVAARSVAGLRAATGCIYVLDPTDPNSYLQSAGSSVIANNCGILVNSSSSTAFDDTVGSCTDATTIQVVGGQSGWEECPETFSNAPVTGIQSFPDPLANRDQPTPACYSGGYQACCSSGYLNKSYSGGTVSPNVYCGGMTITGGSVTMTQGVYYMVGGGFTVASGASVTGTGVTIFNTGTASGAGQYSGINVSGNATLSAPTSGANEGMLFWEDRTIPWSGVGGSEPSQITSGGSTTLTGALYFPTTKLTYSGGSSTAPYTNIVAYQLNVTGTNTFNDSTTTGNGPPAINTASLVQ